MISTFSTWHRSLPFCFPCFIPVPQRRGQTNSEISQCQRLHRWYLGHLRHGGSARCLGELDEDVAHLARFHSLDDWPPISTNDFSFSLSICINLYQFVSICINFVTLYCSYNALTHARSCTHLHTLC